MNCAAPAGATSGSTRSSGPETKPLRAGWLLPAVLSTTAGAVDVIGFLALGGLFTAHITDRTGRCRDLIKDVSAN